MHKTYEQVYNPQWTEMYNVALCFTMSKALVMCYAMEIRYYISLCKYVQTVVNIVFS